MKKGFSIALTLLMLAAIFNVSVSTHYCMGREVAKKVSISGKLADCGMNGSEKSLLPEGLSFNNHCCDNNVTFCGIDNYYSPTYSFSQESFQYSFHVLAIPAGLSFRSQADSNPLYSNESPPGTFVYSSVDLSSICVFRI